jgi:hypothetical protein
MTFMNTIGTRALCYAIIYGFIGIELKTSTLV